jgi:hypothetical protein
MYVKTKAAYQAAYDAVYAAEVYLKLEGTADAPVELK